LSSDIKGVVKETKHNSRVAEGNETTNNWDQKPTYLRDYSLLLCLFRAPLLSIQTIRLVSLEDLSKCGINVPRDLLLDKRAVKG